MSMRRILILTGVTLLIAGGARRADAGDLVVDQNVQAQVFRVGPEGGRIRTEFVDSEEDTELSVNSAADMEFHADYDQDTGSADVFRWFNGTSNSINQAATLEGDGDLLLAGTLSESQSLDLAESFVREGPLEAGDIVRVSPSDPGTVLRLTGADDGAVIGVVSAHPGVVLGGAPFRVEALAEVWGPEIADAYRSRRAALEARVLGERPDLAARLESAGAPQREAGSETEPDARQRAGERPRLARQKAGGLLETATIAAFFEERMVQVALAGRVPVHVDASFGAIRPGDPLAASPEPGVAMRASRRGPVLGTALEGLEAGTGTITMLVHRGWYGGASSNDVIRRDEAPRFEGSTLPAALGEKDARITALRERVERLERMVQALAGEQPDPELVEAAAAPRSR